MPRAVLKLTHPALHIRNTSDALVVLEAVRRGILPLITLRLSGSEREELRSGNVFVWEESMDNRGLVRWTDGRRWSQSKVCAECLFYQEKIEVTEEEREAKALRRARRICNPGTSIPPPRRNQRPSKTGGLTKQTYSFHVRLPGSWPTHKWHVVAYTVWPERGSLPVIEDYPALREIRVPAGFFARSKASDTATNLPDCLSPENRYGSGGEGRRNTDAPGPSRMVWVFGNHPLAPGAKISSFNPGPDGGAGLVLPPISWLKSPSWGEGQVAFYNTPDPVSQEDRRMLDSFRLRF
ncbi:Gti1/Pac2 family-domain-containing protein [Mycena haematopus]|nr:Gti1/Pac2 family-domain-containing protein [Mycena haematopus]KAJ7215215.1 Gti1/Pac2 family-domain-containing protein [Mycena haematopus]